MIEEFNKFTILLWNVALTPGQDNPKHRAKRIGKLLNEYDVVVLNECFLFRNEVLDKTVHICRYTDPSIWYKPFNSGVVILSKFPIWNCRHKTFSDCTTWDAFACKAVLSCTFEVRCMKFDLYGTHLQAGGDASHHAVRLKQAKELVEHVRSTHDPKNQLILCGDWNCGPVADPEFNVFSGHYSHQTDARERHREFATITEGLQVERILAHPHEDDICSFLWKKPHVDSQRKITMERKEVIFADENGAPLSDTAALCIVVNFHDNIYNEFVVCWN
jgi:endonuclease/exonuclease/phosphatase family metal-dependent hydrolase